MKLTGDELFYDDGMPLNFGIQDFICSNNFILNSSVISMLAEFIVCKSLDVAYKSTEYDLIYNNVGVNVKTVSCAQERCRISFGFQKGVDEQAIYVLCIFNEKMHDTLNPLMLEQWTFFLTSGKSIAEHVKKHNHIGITTLTETDGVIKSSFFTLKYDIDRVANND